MDEYIVVWIFLFLPKKKKIQKKQNSTYSLYYMLVSQNIGKYGNWWGRFWPVDPKDWPVAPMTNRRGGIPSLGLVRYIVNRQANIGPYESWPIPTGLSHKFPRGTCVLPIYTPLHGNNLHIIFKDPTVQSNFFIFEKRSPMIQGPLTLYPPSKETPLKHEITSLENFIGLCEWNPR